MMKIVNLYNSKKEKMGINSLEDNWWWHESQWLLGFPIDSPFKSLFPTTP